MVGWVGEWVSPSIPAADVCIHKPAATHRLHPLAASLLVTAR